MTSDSWSSDHVCESDMPAPKIYFAGSIRGGRDDLALYQRLIAYLQSLGTVLTEHIGKVWWGCGCVVWYHK
jgi:hypothetical protein